ncbi:hypothetical protein AJ80_00002 [Polytolypa hystricis UAMH7299]|uniref:Uncharacterized protein n=1 Tax=Polytolypa hystricis (strain UAMH7299) TaxID=1447883 RepID=A0A2B7Z4F1_POLH7|nr:hypothetical protein AJ80_00002 [Polytolypa hystricis UAMH7299]
MSSTTSSRPRLEQLALDALASLNKRYPRLQKESVSFINHGDEELADSLLKQKRQDTFSSKSHLFRRQPSKSGFKHDEIRTTMESIIRNNGSLGVLECLLIRNDEAKREKSLFKFHKRVSTDELNALLRLATELRNSDMVHILGAYADQTGLNDALGLSVALGDLHCCKALLQNGGDPNVCQGAFLYAVEHGDCSLVDLLLSAEKSMDVSCLDQALPLAVTKGLLDVVSGLLQNGANGDYPNVLESAVQAGRVDITSALLLAQRPPSQASLDYAIGIALQMRNVGMELQTLLVEVLLCAGAKGDAVARGLVTAVKTNDEPLVLLLVGHGASVAYSDCEAIIEAITTGKFCLLDILFKARIDPEHASHVLSMLLTIAADIPARKIFGIISSLVQRGAYGDALHACLIDAVQRQDVSVVEYLINKKASVEYQNADALCSAIKSGSLPILKLLLKGYPSQAAFGRCFALLDTLSPKLRLLMTIELLEAGARGEYVAEALVSVVQGQCTTEKEQLILQFIQHGADVNVDEGICFQEAAKGGDLVVLSLLLQGHPSPNSLARGIPAAIKLSPADPRRKVLEVLISAGARGTPVHQGLVDLIDETQIDFPLIKLFLHKGDADVNYHGGLAIQHAAKLGNSEVLKILLKCSPLVGSLNATLPLAIALPDSDTQYKICQRLLAAGVKGDALDSGLLMVQTVPSSHPLLLELLLRYGANVNFNNGATIRKAIQDFDDKQLELLVSWKPSTETLCAALDTLLNTGPTKRNQMGRILLDAAAGRIGDTLNKLLPLAIRLQLELPFLKLLLEYGASVDHQRAEAIRWAIKNLSLEVLDLLLKQQVSQDNIEITFKSAWAVTGEYRYQLVDRVLQTGYKGVDLDAALLEEVQAGSCDGEVVRMLLGHGACVHYSNSECLVRAALSSDRPTLELLLNHVSDRAAVTYTFERLVSTNNNRAWISAAGFAVSQLLLSNGASGPLLDAALVMAIENLELSSMTTEFVDLFLKYQADVNHQNGRALKLAVAKGQPALVRRLLAATPSPEILSSAFGDILESELPEDITLELIEIFAQVPGAIPDLNRDSCEDDGTQREPVTFLALKRWPRGTKVLEALLRSGVHVDKTVPYVIENEEGLEQVSLLLWALLQPEQWISSYVIECILEHGANTNFQSTGTFKTPLLVATMERTPDVIASLVEHGADPSLNDKHGHTPLFYASRRGQVTAMRYLIDSGATINDGSLHEAARELHPQAAQLLLDYGHDPNFPSMSHDGRCALAELCLYASEPVGATAKIRQTISVLVAGNADLTIHSPEKPLLIQALDNPTSCTSITKALLASGMWRLINEEFNHYTYDGFVFSPTMYVAKGLAKSPKEHAPEVLHILKANSCKDVFYKLEGPQPPDIVGAPPHIISEEKRRKTREQRIREQEEEHQHSLRREREVADQQDHLCKRTHALRLDQERETAESRDMNTETSARVQMRLENESATQRQRIAETQRNADLAHQRTLYQLRLDTTDKDNRLQLEYQKTSAQLQQSVLDAKMGAENRRVQGIETANERQYKRDVEVMARQEGILASRKALMSEEMGFAKMVPKPGAPKAIGYNGADLD